MIHSGCEPTETMMAFDKDYFTSGNWLTHPTEGILTTYYWARKYYSRLIRRHVDRGKVLEIGCGFGDLLRNLEATHDTFGVELSPFACAKARRRTPQSAIENSDALEYLRNSVDGFYDAVVQICVLPHMDDPYLALQEIARVTRKEGIFLSVVPNPYYPLNKLKGEQSAMYVDKTHKHLFAIDKWIELTQRCGFEILHQGSTGLWDVPYLPWIPKLVQLGLFGFPSALQVISGRIILPTWLGVDLITIGQKR